MDNVNEGYYSCNTQVQKVVLLTGRQVQVPVHHREECKLVEVTLVRLVHQVAKNIIRQSIQRTNQFDSLKV